MCQISTILKVTTLAALIGTFPSLASAKLKAPAGPISVDCDAGESINEALALGLPGEPLVINVVGTCNENVVITQSQVTLQGVSPAASIIVGQPEPDFDPLSPIDQGPLVINDAGAVVIDNLTIESGVSSNVSVINSQVVITNCMIRDSAINGIIIGEGGRVQVNGCTIENNARDGIQALENGTAYITNSTISGNRHGVQAYGSAFVQIGQHLDGTAGPSAITGNTRDGVRVGGNSEADLYGSEISANGEFGVRIFGASRSFLLNNMIEANVTAGFEQAGVGVFDSSSAELQGNQITNHVTGHGVVATNTSSVVMAGNTVDHNGAGIDFGSGVTILRGSTLQMRGGNVITNNDSRGVEVGQNAFFRASSGAGETITSTGVSAFNGTPRLALNAFNAGYIDIRDGSVITGDVNIQVLSTLRLRNNTLDGNVDIRGNSGLGVRNDVNVTGTVSCDPSVIEFSTGGVSRCP